MKASYSCLSLTRGFVRGTPSLAFVYESTKRALVQNFEEDKPCTHPNQNALTSDTATRELVCWAALDHMAVHYRKPGKSAKIALRGGYCLVCFLQSTSVGSD